MRRECARPARWLYYWEVNHILMNHKWIGTRLFPEWMLRVYEYNVVREMTFLVVRRVSIMLSDYVTFEIQMTVRNSGNFCGVRENASCRICRNSDAFRYLLGYK